MTRTPSCRAALAALLLLLLTPFLCGQSTNATISGRVSDPTQARIAGATVKAINTATNANYQTTTNSSGEYHLTNLPRGTYRLEVEKIGFSKFIKPNVALHLQDLLEINFEMTVGSTSKSITVEAGAPYCGRPELLPKQGRLENMRKVRHMRLDVRCRELRKPRPEQCHAEVHNRRMPAAMEASHGL